MRQAASRRCGPCTGKRESNQLPIKANWPPCHILDAENERKMKIQDSRSVCDCKWPGEQMPGERTGVPYLRCFPGADVLHVSTGSINEDSDEVLPPCHPPEAWKVKVNNDHLYLLAVVVVAIVFSPFPSFLSLFNGE